MDYLYVSYVLFLFVPPTCQPNMGHVTWRLSPLSQATLLGVIVSATDPVAVVALLREVGASKTLGMLIEGESLFNDGVAIVGFKIIIQILNASSSSISDIIGPAFLQVVIVVFGSPLYGMSNGHCPLRTVCATC